MVIRRADGTRACLIGIGELLFTNNTEHPSSTYPGSTWTQIKGKVIAGFDASNSYFNSVGKTGGALSHTHTTGSLTLTIEQIPSHKHMYAPTWVTGSSGNTGKFGFQGESSNYNYGGGAGYSGGGQAHNHGATGSALNLMPYQTEYIYIRNS